MQPKFDQYFEGFGAELACPGCGQNSLHHDRVEVFECAEDATTGLHVTVAEMKSTTDMSLIGNPSKRRHGLVVHFSCEHCDAKPTLKISQHKGSTYVDFTATAA